ncbi:T9SS type A sorting domain-containing protein [Flavobacterium sp. 1]|uniref:T9SS type A sorting domain-containing protein n=1 Tax=Flavobacterium sp. 1 TaxID=2035200 RepID=UPI0012FD7528
MKLMFSMHWAGQQLENLFYAYPFIHLFSGMYFVKISNETQYQIKKFIVTNK